MDYNSSCSLSPVTVPPLDSDVLGNGAVLFSEYFSAYQRIHEFSLHCLPLEVMVTQSFGLYGKVNFIKKHNYKLWLNGGVY